jgi:shikimate 5-dehydrogenase
VASGRDLLLWQAVEQVRLMTGRDPDAGAMSAALPD